MPVHVIITRTRQQMDNFRTLLDSAGVYVDFPEREEKADFDLGLLHKESAKEGNRCETCGFLAKNKTGLVAHNKKHK